MKMEKLDMEKHDSIQYGQMEIKNAISLKVGELLVEYKKNHGELPEDVDEESIIGSVKIAMKAVKDKEKQLKWAKKRKKKWIEIGKKLGVIEE